MKIIGKKTLTSFIIQTPEVQTGVTVVITPATRLKHNTITNITTTENTSTVSGDFYSGNYEAGVETKIVSVEFTCSDSYSFGTELAVEDRLNPDLIIKSEHLAQGKFTARRNIGAKNKAGYATSVTISLSFTPSRSKEERSEFQFGYPIISFAVKPIEDYIETVFIKSFTSASKISNIKQAISVVVKGDEGAKFKVFCTAYQKKNLCDNLVKTIAFGDGDSDVAFSESMGLHVSRVIIPSSATDVEWTLEIVPERGTTIEGEGTGKMTILQQGLRTLKFTDDTSGLTNTTFPDHSTTYSANHGLSKRWVERQTRNINTTTPDNTTDVSIVITASSGVVTLKPLVSRPLASSSFTNINNNGILITNIKTVQTSTTVVTLSFNVRVNTILADISSAIKLSDFLTN